MRAYAALAIALAMSAAGIAYAETNFDTVQFVRYLDENVALGDIRNGNIDAYYWRIPSEWLATEQDRDGLNVYETTPSTYSMLANPAETEEFNPFALRDVRFALNYLLDRDLVVNELMNGLGAPMVSSISPYDPEYTDQIELLESFDFQYDPARARGLIDDAMAGAGAARNGDGIWTMDGQPVELRFFIRNDDQLRDSAGELLARELERAGFAVSRDYGDLNKALAVVYGADPADMEWHLYTEGWGRSDFKRYDSQTQAEMYAPWFARMPGLNDPGFWNYEHPRLDEITRAIFSGDFKSEEERAALVREAVTLGVEDSVRVFMAASKELQATGDDIDGVVNDFGVGIPSRFTAINARSADDTFRVGVKHIYQGSWNPVAGFSDVYSQHIWATLHDPTVFRHPYSGTVIPLYADFDIETSGPDGALEVPPDAILWDPEAAAWAQVGEGVEATSVVTYDYRFGNWHHGVPMGMNDVLYMISFMEEWGTDAGEGDLTSDPEYTSRTDQFMKTLQGVRVIGPDTIEVYVDYWHFDHGEIAEWAAIKAYMPWEMYAAMERAVLDGKTAFSRTTATVKDVSWLSLIIPSDVAIIQEYLEGLAAAGHVPDSLAGENAMRQERYAAALSWIEETGHALISNGPYTMGGYSPESATITVRQFADESYPFEAGAWSEFETAKTPLITQIFVPFLVEPGQDVTVLVATEDASSIKYFARDSAGMTVSGETAAAEGLVTIPLDIAGFAPGAASVNVYAVSETVLRPDSYLGNFFVTGGP